MAVGYAVKIPLTPLSTCGEPTSYPLIVFAFAMLDWVISEMMNKGRERSKVVFFNSKDIYLTRYVGSLLLETVALCSEHDASSAILGIRVL